MSLVKENPVNLRFTHRELTLVLGIIVALIVAVTLWMNRMDSIQSPKKSDAASRPLTGTVKQSVLNIRIL